MFGSGLKTISVSYEFSYCISFYQKIVTDVNGSRRLPNVTIVFRHSIRQCISVEVTLPASMYALKVGERKPGNAVNK